MENAIIPSTSAVSPADASRPAMQHYAFRDGLFEEFVKWIDKSPRTTRTYINNLRQFAAYMRYMGIASPVRDDVISFREWLLSDHPAIQLDGAGGWRYKTCPDGRPETARCKPVTAAQYVRALRQFFEWAAYIGAYPDIASHVSLPKSGFKGFKRDRLTPDEVLSVEKGIDRNTRERIEVAAAEKKDTEGRVARATEQGARMAAMYQLAVVAGLRPVELSRADVGDLEIRSGQAWLNVWGKGRMEPDEKVPVPPEVYAVIRAYLDLRKDGARADSPLFVSTGNRSGGKRLSTTSISTLIKNALKDAGFDSPRLTAHSLRHSAGTAVMEVTGDNIYQTQQYMRHSDPKITEVYTHRKDDQKRVEITRRVYRLYHGEGAMNVREEIDALLDGMPEDKLEEVLAVAKGIADR